jgi:hypothetical protein
MDTIHGDWMPVLDERKTTHRLSGVIAGYHASPDVSWVGVPLAVDLPQAVASPKHDRCAVRGGRYLVRPSRNGCGRFQRPRPVAA